MKMKMKIIQTSNFGGDKPREKFVKNLPLLRNKEQAEIICTAINKVAYERGLHNPRFWKVVEDSYIPVRRIW